MHQQLLAAANADMTLADAGGLQSSMAASLFATEISEIFWELICFALMLAATLILKGRQVKKPTAASKLGAPKCPPSPPQRSPVASGKADSQLPPWRRAAAEAKQGGVAEPKIATATKIADPVAQRISDIVRNAAARLGNAPDEVVRLYEEMRATGDHLKVQASVKLSGHSVQEFYGGLIRCAGRCEKVDLLDQILDDMALNGVACNRTQYEAVMKLLAGKGHYRQALSMFQRMEKDGLEPTAVTLECLSSFAAELGDAELALNFFQRLLAQGTPSIRAYMTVLHVHGARKDFASSRELFDDMLRRGVAADSYALNIILSTGVTAGALEGTRQLLEKAQGMEAPVGDVVSYNTVLKAYSQASDPQPALDLLALMSSRGLAPNSVTFNTVMDAAVKGSKVDDAWRVLASMRSAGLQPDKFTCSILMKGLRSGASAERVDQVIEMTTHSRCDNTLLVNVFRGSLDAASHLNNAALVRRILAQMETSGIQFSNVEIGIKNRLVRQKIRALAGY